MLSLSPGAARFREQLNLQSRHGNCCWQCLFHKPQDLWPVWLLNIKIIAVCQDLKKVMRENTMEDKIWEDWQCNFITWFCILSFSDGQGVSVQHWGTPWNDQWLGRRKKVRCWRTGRDQRQGPEQSVALANALGLSQKLFLPRSYSFQDLGFLNAFHKGRVIPWVLLDCFSSRDHIAADVVRSGFSETINEGSSHIAGSQAAPVPSPYPGLDTCS